MSRFDSLVARMDSRVQISLGNGTAQYTGRTGAPVVADIEVLVDRNLMQTGPDGMFRSDAVGVTWRKEQLQAVERGGVFLFGAERLVVEDTISDDGQMATAACMVQP